MNILDLYVDKHTKRRPLRAPFENLKLFKLYASRITTSGSSAA
jgi:hypothetical protein